MKKLILIALFLFQLNGYSQQQEKFENNKYVLLFSSNDMALNTDTKSSLVETFFEVYPKLVKDFNRSSPDTVKVAVDTTYDGVAYAHKGQITISADWLRKKPNDIDLITHELMHIVQAYPPDSGPGWLTEGIADYIRFKYGVDNKTAQWSLPDYSTEQSYKDSYRITGRFLLWLTKQYDKKIVKKLDKDLRNRMYTEDSWEKYTKRSLDQLWAEYSKSPQIK